MFEHQIGLKHIAHIFIFSRTPSHTSNKSNKLTNIPTGNIEEKKSQGYLRLLNLVFARLINFFCQNHPAVELKIQKGEDGVAWLNTGSHI